jgi:hypothetical protein
VADVSEVAPLLAQALAELAKKEEEEASDNAHS